MNTNEPRNVSQPRSWRRFQKLKFQPSKVRKRLTKAEARTTRHAHRLIIKRLDNLRDARRQIIGWFVVVGVIIMGLGVQVFLLADSYTQAAASADGTYSEGMVGTMSTLNPLYASSAPEVAASKLIFSSLYEYDQTGALSPDVAKNTAISADGKTYTVTLRDDVKWQDGRPLTANDVVFTINTIKNPATNATTLLASTWQDVSVKATGEYAVQFTLPVYAGFMQALTFPILPAHILQDINPANLTDAKFSLAPIGSGPFEFKLLQSVDDALGEKVIHMVANPNYYGPTPRLARFEIHNYASSSELNTALRTNEVTAVADIDSVAAKKNLPNGYQIQNYTIDDGVFLIFNTTQPDVKDVSVRQAIQQTLNIEDIRKAAGGNVPALDLPFIASQVPGAPHAQASNIKHARELLDAAGWKLNGAGQRVKDGTVLELQFKTISNPQYKRVAKAIVSQLAAVGIKVNLTVIDTSNRSSNFVQTVLQPRAYDMLLYELSVGADPDQYAYWHSSQTGIDGYNFANYNDPVADAALLTARDRLDPVLRTAKYTVFANQWLQDVPAVGLYQQTVTYVHTKKSTSINPSAKYVTTSDRYGNIANWSVGQQSVYKTP